MEVFREVEAVMRKLKAGILIIITAACVFSGCSRPDNTAADYIEPAVLSSVLTDAPSRTEQEESAVQAFALADDGIDDEPEATAEQVITAEITSAAVTAGAAPVITETVPEVTTLAPVIIPEKTPRAENDKWLALTFDDGPGKYTQDILDLLEKHGGKATFFVVGTYVWKYRDVVRNIFAQGSEAAGHSWHHYNLTQIDAQSVKDQITYTDNAILSAAGVSPPKFFRPPYGSYNELVREAAREVGAALILWNIDPSDWQERNANAIYERIMEKAKDGAIILCHDAYETTAEAMARVIPDLIAQGYKLVTVSELLGETLMPGLAYYSERNIKE